MAYECGQAKSPRRWLRILVSLCCVWPVCAGCSQISEPKSPVGSAEVMEILTFIGSNGCSAKSLVEVEDALSLPEPVAWREPSEAAPNTWWFAYRIDGLLLELGTNAEGDPADRNSHWCCIPYYVASHVPPDEFLEPGQWPARCIELRGLLDRPQRGEVVDVLNSADMSDPPLLSDLEKQLRFSTAVRVVPPAFSSPYWVFVYKAYGRTWGLRAMHFGDVDWNGDPEATDQFKYAGIWSAGPTAADPEAIFRPAKIGG